MPNELIFLVHAAVTIGLSLGALALGKEALVATVAVQAVLANFLVLKQISLFGFSVTAASIYIVGCMTSVNFLQEYYGKDAAAKSTYAFMLALVWYVAVSRIHLWYEPLSVDWAHPHFAALFQHAPRLVFASIVAFFFGLRINRWIFAVVSRAFGQKALWLRNLSAVTVSQAADTAIFAFLGLYGIAVSIGHIILVSTAIKVAATILISPLIEISRFLVPKER